MSDGARIVTLDVAVPRAEVVRYLGYDRRGTPSSRVLARLDGLWPAAAAWMAARGAFRVVDAATATAAGVPDVAGRTAVAVVTVGPRLEAECARCTGEGAMLDALVLDAFGSAAAEAAADALEAEICATARAGDAEAGARISPGYGTWPVAAQPALLALLPLAELGLSLTTGAMMVPRKSVSFAMPLEAPAGAVRGRGCAACRAARCPYRKQGDTP